MTAREVKKLLKEAGWTFEKGGHHRKAVSPDGKTKVPIPEHGSADITIGTLKAIEKQTGIQLRGRG